MNTQRQVFEKLAKQKLGAKDKQNLGAIEDAIREVQDNLNAKANEISTLVNDFNAEIKNSQSKALALAEELQTAIQQAGMSFNDAEAEYKEMAKELLDLGIPFNDIFPEIGTEYSDLYDIADNLIFNLGN
jgi:outer membrane murein-binding lipoprotein Lpp